MRLADEEGGAVGEDLGQTAAIEKALDASLADLQWVLDAYALSPAVARRRRAPA